VAGTPAAPAAGAPASGAPAAGTPDASSLVQAPGAPAAAGTDWIQEKYRVTKEDGSIDIEASARKVSEAHTALEKRMGAGEAPPAAADAYEPAGLPADFAFDEVKADPMYQEFAKEAHALHFNNAQMGLVLKAWAERGGAVAGEAMGLSVEEAAADLRTTWSDDASFKANIEGASGAIHVIATKAGLTVEQINEAGLGRNPTFMRLMASLKDEFKPDGSTPQGGALAAADFDSKLAALKATPGYDDAKHPDHKKLMEQKQALYDARYPPQKPK
jgi:hypothetical protein